jgi:predicted enzyme involved in methoxymalonyl-ACP biosynthesis
LADDARAQGAIEFVGSYIPTAKNALCKSFLADQGFEPIGDQQWHLALSDAPVIPAYIQRMPVADAAPSETLLSAAAE